MNFLEQHRASAKFHQSRDRQQLVALKSSGWIARVKKWAKIPFGCRWFSLQFSIKIFQFLLLLSGSFGAYWIFYSFTRKLGKQAELEMQDEIDHHERVHWISRSTRETSPFSASHMFAVAFKVKLSSFSLVMSKSLKMSVWRKTWHMSCILQID